MANLHNQLWTRSGLVSIFASHMFLHYLSSHIWPFFLHEASLGHLPQDRFLSLSWSAQTATSSCQVWCNGRSNSNPYLRNVFSLITFLLILPTVLSSQSRHLKLTPIITQRLPLPYRLLQMAFNANIISTVPHWFGLTHLLLIHPAVEWNHLPFPEVSYLALPPGQCSYHLLSFEC